MRTEPCAGAVTPELLTRLQAFCAELEPRLFAVLERLVNLNSYTWNKQGAEANAAVLAEVLTGLGLHLERVPHETVGDTLVLRTPAALRQEQGQLLFCGHLDTVFPPELGFLELTRHGERVQGPGIIDMKGGLVAALGVLECLRELGLLRELPLCFVINADEEVGSPFSTPVIEREAARSACALVFECSGLQGEVVTARKGKRSFELHCRGRAGHVGQAGQDKPSAVLELAHKIIALEACNAVERGLTCNVGRIQGGTTPNSVPESATASVDCRFLTAADGEALGQELERIVARQDLAGVVTTLVPKGERKPMECGPGTRRLYELLCQCGSDLGITVREERRGGVSDANTIAALGVPVLDGLGPAGDRDHSTEEFMLAPSLRERVLLGTLLVLRCLELRREGRWQA